MGKCGTKICASAQSAHERARRRSGACWLVGEKACPIAYGRGGGATEGSVVWRRGD